MATIFRDRSDVAELRPRAGGLRLFQRRSPSPAPLPQPARQGPTKVDLISVLVSKHGATEDQAASFVDMMCKVRDQAPRPYVLNSVDIRWHHRLLAMTVPSAPRVRALGGPTEAQPGSTLELMNRVLLKDGHSFVHGRTDDQCSVVVSCT